MKSNTPAAMSVLLNSSRVSSTRAKNISNPPKSYHVVPIIHHPECRPDLPPAKIHHIPQSLQRVRHDPISHVRIMWHPALHRDIDIPCRESVLARERVVDGSQRVMEPIMLFNDFEEGLVHFEEDDTCEGPVDGFLAVEDEFEREPGAGDAVV